MTQDSALIQRLQSLKTRTQRMLTPGSKSSPGLQPVSRLSPLLDEFSSQKYLRIGESMRSLNKNRINSLQTATNQSIAETLPTKFANTKALLHVKSAASNQSIWGEVEQTLPAGATPASPERQSPDEPGILRQGSIIQKMQTVPKPGQSIESFKQQIQSRTASQPSQKPAAPTPKPTIEPGPRRRYTKVEEITKKENTPGKTDSPSTSTPPANIQRQREKTPETEIPKPEITPSQPESDTPTGTPPTKTTPDEKLELARPKPAPAPQTEPKAPTPPAPQEKKAESATPRPVPAAQTSSPTPAPSEKTEPAASNKPTPVPQAQPASPKQASAPQSEMPVAQHPTTKSTPPTAAPQQTETSPQPDELQESASPPVQPSENQTQEPAQPTESPRLVAQPAPRPQAPDEKAPTARPLPVRRLAASLPPAAKLAKALPTAPRTAAPAPGQTTTRPANLPGQVIAPKSSQKQSQPAIIQRQSDDTPTPSATLPDLVPQSIPANLPLAQAPGQEPRLPEASPSSGESLPTAQSKMPEREIPILSHISQRKSTAQQIRFLESKLIKPQNERPALIQPELRQIRPASPATIARQPQETPATVFSVKLSGPEKSPTGQPAQIARQNLEIPGTRPAEMPLIRKQEPPQFAPVAIPQAPAAQIPQPANPYAAAQQTDVAPAPPSAPSSTAGNVVQRLWENHSPPASSSSARRESGESKQDDETPESALDLNKLAEEVLPIVKRLIEIESERSSGYLR